MKIGGMVAASTLAVTGVGAAHAQTAACNQMLLLQTSGLAQIKELRGVESKRDARSITYLSKTQAVGFSGCTIREPLKQSTKSGEYEEYSFTCSHEFANSEAATVYVESLYACVKDVVAERDATEHFMDGKYRIVEIDTDTWADGKASEFDFGESEFVRLWVRKSFPASDEVHLNLFYYFKP